MVLLAATEARGADPSPLWGRLANPAFANERIRTTLFFSGQASDGSNPYGIADPPGSRLFLYTAHPTDDRHLQWSESDANRDFALSQMVGAGINVVTMSSWGESFLDSRPRPPWAIYAPMQTSPGSHDELFTAAVGKPLMVTPLIESRGDWNLRQEFPNPQGNVAPGATSQIVDLVNRYLKNESRPEWAEQWARVYDRNGEERYAVALIHAASNLLEPHEHAAYAQGFDALADEVFARTGVKVGFMLDVLPRNSFAPGNFKPTPEATGPELSARSSILGVQNFLPEIWAGAANEAARLDWKRDFSSRWAATGIPFLMDIAPGYDAHVVFPGSVQYGHNPAWIDGMTALVQDFGQDGLVYNSWNGYTEAMLAVPSSEHGNAYYQWLGALSLIHEQWRWIGNIGRWTNGLNWNHGRPTAQTHAVLDNGGTIRLATVESVKLFDIGTGANLGGTIEISGAAALTIHDGGFRLGQVDGSQGNLVMTGGSVQIVGGFNMFLVGDHGHGTATISGGSITARTFGIALQPTSTGHVELSGDAVITTTGDRFVMGMTRNAVTGERPAASLTMSGGIINVNAGLTGFPDVVIGFDGVADLDMSGGTINVAGLFVSAVAGPAGLTPKSRATINHSGGTINATRMAIAERGITDYTLSGTGEINIGRRLTVGWLESSEATLTQNGGTVHVDIENAAVGGVGLLVADRGRGTYTISGGELGVTQRLWIAEGAGSLGRMNIHGGAVHVGENFALGVQGDAALTQTAGVLNIGGSLQIANGVYASSVGMHVHAGGILNISDTLNVGRGDGNGTSNISGGSVTVGNLVRVWSTGTMSLSGGTLAAASIRHDEGGGFQFTGGTLHVADFTGHLANTAGTLAVTTASTTTITGNYTQQVGATLAIEIGELSAGGVGHAVSITGSASLDGQLQLALLAGFVPSASDMFAILSAASLSGMFHNAAPGERLETINGSGSFLVHYGPTSAFGQNEIVLTGFQLAALAGDFNRDGLVDAADYVRWRKQDGTPEEYDDWRANFGATAASGSASVAAVPEPGCLMLLALAAATGLLTRRRGLSGEQGARVQRRQSARMSCRELIAESR